MKALTHSFLILVFWAIAFAQTETDTEWDYGSFIDTVRFRGDPNFDQDHWPYWTKWTKCYSWTGLYAPPGYYPESAYVWGETYRQHKDSTSPAVWYNRVATYLEKACVSMEFYHKDPPNRYKWKQSG